MNIGIVGAEAAKFTPETERQAKVLILRLLEPADVTLVSGGCHLGGIDIWAEEAAAALDRPKIIHCPKVRTWSGGYRARNLKIARESHALHNITVAAYPETFTGMRFPTCYHCQRRAREHPGVSWWPHVKSGGCWTAMEAEKLGTPVWWHVVAADGIHSYPGGFQ